METFAINAMNAMNKAVIRFTLLLVLLLLACAFAGCREKKVPQAPHATREMRERAEEQAVQSLAGDTQEIRRRVNSAYINVPGIEEPVHLIDGRGDGPGKPAAFSVELRSVAGIVPGAQGIDVFADLAIHRSPKAADCYLALLNLDSIEAVHTASLSIGAGARVLSVEAANRQGDVYDLKVDYLPNAPEGSAAPNPAERKQKVVKVAHHGFGEPAKPPVAPH